MTYEETLKLIDAGFSADEIRKMAEEGTQDKTGDDTAKEPGAGDQEHESKVTEPSEEMKALMGEVTKLTETVKKLQEINVKNASTGSASAADPVDEQIQSFLKEL